MAEVLVTGGTGTLGSRVVAALGQSGHGVRVLSRRDVSPAGDGGPNGVRRVEGDLGSGAGLGEAVAGVEAIVHCASATGTLRRRTQRAVDVEGTRRLAAAARAAGSPRLLYPSIVGIDELPFSYYRAKRAAEAEVAHSDLPWAIVRATQFHDLILGALRALDRGPVLILPRAFRLQPVDAGEVADRLVELLEEGATGRARDFGGPQELSAHELGALYRNAKDRPRMRLVNVPVPGRTARAVRAGSLLCPGGAAGRVSFADFLGRHRATPADRTRPGARSGDPPP